MLFLSIKKVDFGFFRIFYFDFDVTPQDVHGLVFLNFV